MRRSPWIWIAVGTGGAAILLARRRSRLQGAQIATSPTEPNAPKPTTHGDLIVPSLPHILGMPIEVRGVPQVTPHGYFSAHRDGPPEHSHQGVDLQARAGSHVLAVGDGRIIATEPGLGKLVRKLKLDSPGGWNERGTAVYAIVYADLGKALVEPGDRVRKGDPVALVAPAGFVHFAVKTRRGGNEEFFDPKLAGFVYRLPAGMEELS